MHITRQLYSLFDRQERWKLALLSAALVARALVEVVGVASITPFLRVVADPTLVERNAVLLWAYEGLGFSSMQPFLVAMGLAAVVVLTVSNTFSALALWAMLRFSWGTHHRLSLRLLKGYLGQPYGVFVQRNSASFSKTILSEVYSFIKGVLTPVLNVIARTLVIVSLVGLLIFLDPPLALLVVAVLGGAYGSLYLMIKHKQRRLGRDKVDSNHLRYKVTGEAFGGIKEVKVLQRESAFVEQYAPPSLRFSRAIASNATIEQVPRYALEVLAFGGIVLIVLYYLHIGEGVDKIFPIAGLYTLAGYRLMPELQHLFESLARIRFHTAALDDITADLRTFAGAGPASAEAPLPFRESIHLDDVVLRYPGASSDALCGASLTIRRNQIVGLVGASGSGKTTLVDLLLGLYVPDRGEVRIDGVPLRAGTMPAWLRQVGYVPQHIFLCDDTIANNIAFGTRPEDVDPARVERAARIAHLHGFVQSLPDGYRTVVGERGVRLSGGQRQRIGIARALYHDPAVLVLDEATSALDGATEEAVMEAIRALSGQKTIILIAHRLSTVAECDRIYLLHKGRVRDAGTYEDLASRSKEFRHMAKLERGVARGTASLAVPEATP